MNYARIDTLPLLAPDGLSAEFREKLESNIALWRKRPYGDTHDICASEHDGREEDDFGEEDQRDYPLP